MVELSIDVDLRLVILEEDIWLVQGRVSKLDGREVANAGVSSRDHTLMRKSPRWFVITHPRGSVVNTSQLSVSWKLCLYKVTWLGLLHNVGMLTHQLDVKIHIVHYAKSAFNVYFYINLACKIKVNSTCFTKSRSFVNTRKLCECD